MLLLKRGEDKYFNFIFGYSKSITGRKEIIQIGKGKLI